MNLSVQRFQALVRKKSAIEKRMGVSNISWDDFFLRLGFK